MKRHISLITLGIFAGLIGASALALYNPRRNNVPSAGYSMQQYGQKQLRAYGPDETVMVAEEEMYRPAAQRIKSTAQRIKPDKGMCKKLTSFLEDQKEDFEEFLDKHNDKLMPMQQKRLNAIKLRIQAFKDATEQKLERLEAKE